MTDNTMIKINGTKRQTMIDKILQRNLKIDKHELHLKLKYSRRESNSCSTCGTRRVILGRNPVVSHEEYNDMKLS